MTAQPLTRLGTILSALSGQPRTLTELSGDLGSSPGAVEGMLQTLFASGYVQDASPTADGCACNGCSLKSMCRNAAGDVPALNLLRLTEKGEKLVAKSV